MTALAIVATWREILSSTTSGNRATITPGITVEPPGKKK
jgi:hypothetical protein